MTACDAVRLDQITSAHQSETIFICVLGITTPAEPALVLEKGSMRTTGANSVMPYPARVSASVEANTNQCVGEFGASNVDPSQRQPR